MSTHVLARLGLFILGMLTALVASPAFAQGDVARTVVLKIREGGTERLQAALETLPGVELRDQTWFVQKVKQTDVPASRLMSRPGDLRFVMSSAGIRYIIAVQPDGEAWAISIYDDSGDIATQFQVLRSGGELTADEAAVAKQGVADFLGVSLERDRPVERAQPPAEEEAPTDTEAADVPTAEASDATAERPAPPQRSGSPSFELGVAAGALKRDVTYAADNGAILSFRSVLYPAGRLRAALFPESLRLGAGDVGFVLDGLFGLDSLGTPDGSIGILHIEGELAVALRTSGPLTVELGGRHERFQLAQNDFLPSTSSTFARLGLRFDQNFGSFDLTGRADAIPFLLGGQGTRLFGESGFGYGFGAYLGFAYRLGASTSLQVGNRFRLLRTVFGGQGAADFRDTRAFELVWGPDVGITLAF